MDERPKRRRYKDNPYYLEKNSLENNFFVLYKADYEIKKIKVSQEVYNEFDNFEKQDLSELNQFDRHTEHYELEENSLYKRAVNKEKSIEKIVEKKIQYELLYNALSNLSLVQKRRITMYYFYEMKLKEIAEKENCSIMSIKDSIDIGIRNLKKFYNIP